LRHAGDQRQWSRHHGIGRQRPHLARHSGYARARRGAGRRARSRSSSRRRHARRCVVSTGSISVAVPLVPQARMIRILVVDDHALVRRGIIEILQRLPDGVQFGEAGTAAEALALGATGRWDVVLLDLGLPDRQFAGLRLLAAGSPITAISRALGLSPKTVTTYRARLLHKLRMKSNAELTFYATQHGLVSPSALRASSSDAT